MNVLWLLMIFGCAKRDVDLGISGMLTEADVAWAQRAEGGLGPVLQHLTEAYGQEPRNPDVLWRLERLYLAVGLSAGSREEALDAYATARGHGFTCLGTAASIQREEEDVPSIPNQAASPCAGWTALAWARWWQLFGPAAAALDTERILDLADSADEAGGDTALTSWTRGIVAARRTDGNSDLAESAKWLDEAIAENPDEAWQYVDRILLVAVPQGDQAAVDANTKALLNVTGTPENIQGRQFIEQRFKVK